MRFSLRLITSFFILTSFTACSGIFRLKEYADDVAMQQKEAERQKDNFYRLKKAINEGKINMGMLKKRIKKIYGLPQIEKENEIIYKPRTAIDCSGAIYFYFDNDKLISWKIRPEK